MYKTKWDNKWDSSNDIMWCRMSVESIMPGTVANVVMKCSVSRGLESVACVSQLITNTEALMQRDKR
jgi:hypothetical protein